MKRGEIDAMSNLDPVISPLEANGDAVAVVDTRTAKGMQEVYGGAYAAGCIYVPVDFAKKNPTTTQALVNAMVRALRFIQTVDRPTRSSPPCRPTTTPTRRNTRPRSRRISRRTSTTGRSRCGRADGLRDLKSFDETVQKANIDLAKTIDMSFAQKAAQKYR